MQALLFDGQLRLVTDFPEPDLVPDEAIIRPHLVGICNTDLEIVRGYLGFRGVLGHEFVGTVVACPQSDWVGMRVVGEINAACRRCAVCLHGDIAHCPNRTTLGIDRRDGAMADLFRLPIACLHAVPDGLPDSVAVFVEPVAAALEILEQMHLRPSDDVVVVGDGKLGMLCAQVLRLCGCAVSVVGRHPERWAVLQALGIVPFSVESSAQVGSGASRYDVVVDCTGQPGGMLTARALVRPGGRLVLKSTFAADSVINLSMVVVDEIQVLGSRCGPFAPALRLLERNLIVTEPLIADRFRFAEGLEAFRAAAGQLKMVLEM